jgi:hypothetical protein
MKLELFSEQTQTIIFLPGIDLEFLLVFQNLVKNKSFI